MLPQHKVNLFYVFLVELNRLEFKFQAAKVKTQILLDIFCPFILSLKRKSTILSILQAFLQTLFERSNERDSSAEGRGGGGGAALECNLTGRCPFFKSLQNPFRKKFAFRYPVSEFLDYKIVLENSNLLFLNK